jgi:hypothetical protein
MEGVCQRRVRVALIALASSLVLAMVAAPSSISKRADQPASSAMSTTDCNRDTATSSTGQSPEPAPAGSDVKSPPSLESTGPADPINVAWHTGTPSTDIVLTASPSLPANITPAQITIEVPARFRRTGTNTPTQFLPDPTFSAPRILESRKLISFRLCFKRADIHPGSYIGQVVVSAPGIQPTTVAVSLNDKRVLWFWGAGVLAVLIAFALLLFQGAVSVYKGQAASKKSVKKALKEPLKDFFGFWAPSVVAIVAAGVAMYQIYAADPAWGADKGTALIALVGSAVAAAGLGTLLAGFKKS